MSSTIKTYSDLCEERDRVKNLLAVQRQRVVDDWQQVKEELSPVRNAFGVLGKIAHADKSNPLVNIGLQIASEAFLKNFILAKAGWVTKLAVPFVMRNYSSHLIAEKGRNFLGKLGSIFSRKRNTQPANFQRPGLRKDDDSLMK